MDTAEAWRESFANWSEELPRRGILVTNYNEQIQFETFLTGAEFLLVIRNAPDALGARQLLIPYGHIQALKFIDVIEPRTWQKAGFIGKSTASSSRPASPRTHPPRP